MLNVPDRRLRRYVISDRLLIGYLSAMADWPDLFGRAIIEGVPIDAKIVDAEYDRKLGFLYVTIWHPSFELVDSDTEIPLEQKRPGVRIVWFVRGADGVYRMTDDRDAAFAEAAAASKELARRGEFITLEFPVIRAAEATNVSE